MGNQTDPLFGWLLIAATGIVAAALAPVMLGIWRRPLALLLTGMLGTLLGDWLLLVPVAQSLAVPFLLAHAIASFGGGLLLAGMFLLMGVVRGL